MARTQVRSHQILDEGIKKDDLNTTDSGQAVITKVVAGSGISLDSTGVDAGTGDVTVNVNFTSNQSMNDNKITDLAAPSDANDAANKEYVDAIAGSVDKFDYDDSGDLMPASADSNFIFELDDNDDLMFTASGTIDADFELDINEDIQPKE